MGSMIPASESRFRGRWNLRASAPVDVADPARARQLLGLRPRPELVERAVLPLSVVRDFLAKADRLSRQEFERLLSGGGTLWELAYENAVVNEGLDHLLDVTLSGGTQDTTWFVGLTDGTPTVAGADTLASHAGWGEVTAYDETNRVAFVDAGVSSQSMSNAASPATFTIDTNSTTVGGAFLAGVNTGTSGILYAAGAFTAGDKSLDDNDTLDVTATFTAAAA